MCRIPVIVQVRGPRGGAAGWGDAERVI